MDAGFKIENGILEKYEGSDPVVVIPDGVTEIGECAFKESKTLTDLVIPDSVTSIAKHAFLRCAKLKNVTFSKSLVSIGDGAFTGCKALKEIELPKTLKAMGYGAFAGCTKLAKAVCDSEVYEIGSNPFYAYSEPECAQLFDKNGFLIFANVLHQYNGDAEVITVPDGVTHIADSVFNCGKYCRDKKVDITKIVLPASVKYVGKYAFANCAKLKEIKMPEGIQFGTYAFDGCTELSDENGLVIIGNIAHAFLGENTHVNIPEGVEILADGLFSAAVYDANLVNNKITEIVLPESLKHIGNNAFRDCVSLRKINIPKSVETIGNGAFYGCISLKEVEVPKAATIFNQAFNNCKGLADEDGYIVFNDFLFQYVGTAEDVIVPKTIKFVGTGAFSNLRVKKITLPEGLSDLGAAFENCDWLEEIEIPEGLTAILAGTFKSCQALKKVSLPGSITKIGESAFAGCELLEEVQIPEGVTQIGKNAFMGCKALKTLRFPACLKVIPEGVCGDCAALERVIISDGIESIERSAFFGCAALKQLSLPKSVQKIEDYAFGKCVELEMLDIENPDGNIKLNAFEDCPKLIDKSGMKIIAGVLVAYKGHGGVVEIPDTVHTIAPDAFREGESRRGRYYVSYREEGGLHEVVIPSGVKKICDAAFCGCKKLNKVTMECGVEEIAENAFAECETLREITLPQSLRYLGKCAFAESGLTSVVIPKELEVIGLDAFRRCNDLVNIFVEEGSVRYSEKDGILYDAEKTELLYCPAGKKLTTFTVEDHVCCIADHALIDCEELKCVVIPASVKKIGNDVLVRDYWNRASKLEDIRIAVGAGADFVGENVIDFPYGDGPLVYPTVPILFPKEQTIQVRLGLGFCRFPEKYTGEYAEGYRKYVKSHQKTLLKKAAQLGLKDVEAYFEAGKEGGAERPAAYKPDLTLKKPSELQKVEILEEVVRKGTLDDLLAVLHTYKAFEMTARALGMAARYRGVDFVRALAEHGANFIYESTPALQRKYSMSQTTAAGCYSTEYYLLVVPEKLKPSRYAYTPMCGVPQLNISPEEDEKTLPLKDRIEVVKYFMESNMPDVSFDEMLFWALTRNEVEFADALMELGVDLQKTPPGYYPSWGEVPTYMETITSGKASVYWNSYVSEMTRLEAKEVLPALERLGKLATAAGKKLMFSQKLFDELNWCDESMVFALEYADVSKINQKKALEMAVLKNMTASLAKMAEAGWISQPAKREALIEFARKNQCAEALAWILDYKNRTVDVVAEAAKAEAKVMRELTENPNSVSALKKIWSYKKLEDGTLKITNYKGTDTEVIVPAQIGKSVVSTIGEDTFAVRDYKTFANAETRKRITSVVLPDGVREIEYAAFFACESLVSVTLPSTLKIIGPVAFRYCRSLEKLDIPKGIENICHNSFWGCDKLPTGKFMIAGGILFGYSGNEEMIEIPEGVTVIGEKVFEHVKNLGKLIVSDTVEEIGKEAFTGTSLEMLELPASLKRINERAFYSCRQLKEIRLHSGLEVIGKEAFNMTAIRNIIIPETVTELGKEAFDSCYVLRDISVPASVKSIGEKCFGWGDGQGKYIHTTEGAFVAEYVEKNYPAAVVFYDYGKEDYR